jgi:hypothetical protein
VTESERETARQKVCMGEEVVEGEKSASCDPTLKLDPTWGIHYNISSVPGIGCDSKKLDPT